MGPWKDYESILYGALSCRVWYCKNYFKNGKIETLECVTIATRGEASSAIIDRYQMAIEATAGINIQTMSSIWCKIMGNIRMAGNWILFLDVDLFTENRSLEVLQSIKSLKACYCKKRLKKERLSYNKEMICSNFMGGTVDVDQSRFAPYRQLAKINWNLMLVSFIK